jgi:hypothetical protein
MVPSYKELQACTHSIVTENENNERGIKTSENLIKKSGGVKMSEYTIKKNGGVKTSGNQIRRSGSIKMSENPQINKNEKN